MTAAFALVRALHFASLMGVFGTAALLFQACGVADAAPWRRPLAAAALLALATAAANLCFAAAEVTGDPAAAIDIRALATVVTQTAYGHILLLRLLALAGLLLVCLADGAFALKTALAGAALALLGLTSHAAASGPPQYAYARAGVDALHLLTAGFWVGGLAVLVREVMVRPRNMARLIALLRLFSRWGAVSVAVLIAAGAANAVLILGQGGMRWSQVYVTWLAVKIVLAALMVALALTNRFGVLPGLARGDKEAADTIPLTVIAELSCAAAILLVVGFLGVTAPMEM